MLTLGALLLSGLSMAVTFDDLPGNPQEGPDAATQVAINTKIVATLKERSIPAIGFVNGLRLETDGKTDPAKAASLRVWTDAGFELGNHSYSHLDLHRVPLETWLADVERGEEAPRAALAEKGKELRWFRHPYLHTGLDLETRAAVLRFLEGRKMRVAPVTIDNGEWIFARAYLLADDAARKKIADAYVTYMEAKVDYYERESRALFGRTIPQILLVHANRLNADHFDRIAAMLAKRGYRFVTLGDAVSDPAYGTKDTFTGRGGITWLHRWAISTGRKDEILPGEPECPRFVLDAAGVESE